MALTQKETTSTPVDKKKEWTKICQESQGNRILLTGSQETDAVAFQNALDEHVQRTMEFNKQTAIFENLKDNYFFKLRKELEEAGMADVWEKGLSFDNHAKKDKIMVINVSQSQQ